MQLIADIQASNFHDCISNSFLKNVRMKIQIWYRKQYSWHETNSGALLTPPTNPPCISESCIKIKVNLNSYFHTQWCLKRFYEGLGHLRHHKEVKIKVNLHSWPGIRTGRVGLNKALTHFKPMFSVILWQLLLNACKCRNQGFHLTNIGEKNLKSCKINPI